MNFHFILFAACAASIAKAGVLLDVERMAGLPAAEIARIVGGKPTTHGAYPFMVSLLRVWVEKGGIYSLYDCGASVLNENWIITSAYCTSGINDPEMETFMLVGLHKISRQNPSSVQTIEISKVIVHENYNNETQENDIALLKTATPIDIAGSEFAGSISLPTTTEYPTGTATVLGWGVTSEGSTDNSDILREVTVPIVPRNVCNTAYDGDLDDGIDEITENMICAGMENKDSCDGDVGGPLFQTNNEGVATLIGIVSGGEGCGRKNSPGIYTKVSSYLTWIDDAMSDRY